MKPKTYYLIKDTTCFDKIARVLYKKRPDFVDELSSRFSFDYLLNKVKDKYFNKQIVGIRIDSKGQAVPMSSMEDVEGYTQIQDIEDTREQITVGNRKLRSKI